MRERQPGDRLRVVIAGNIYAKRALVRRFLEDDGFEVVGEALTTPELLQHRGLASADAVVADADLLHGSLDSLRAAAPDAAIVVFTPGPAASAAPPGADGYLEKGMGLASLTALLHSLLSEAPVSSLGLGSRQPVRRQPAERRVLAGLGGIAAGIVLVAVFALVVFGGGRAPLPVPVEQTPEPTSRSESPSAIELAMGDVRQLREAFENGRMIEARWTLFDLRQDLHAARGAGFSLLRVQNLAANLLRPSLLGDVQASVLDELQSLFPFLEMPQPAGGGGNVVTGGSTVLTGGTSGGTTSGGTTSGGSTLLGGTTSGGTEAGGTQVEGPPQDGGDTQIFGGNGGGGVILDTDGEAGGAHPSGGNGNHFGWDNKPPDGGWHGDKPPDGTSHANKPPDGGWHGDKPQPTGSARHGPNG